MFSPIKNVKVYEQVVEQIEEMIADGTLKKGDKLPSERDLVENLKVSRTSIREALRSLEIIGLVECRQGEGNFIKQNFENTLFEPLSVMFMLENGSPADVIELRKVIEVQTVSIAAQRVTEEELKRIYEQVNNLENSDDENKRVKADKNFHYEIAKASKNFLIVNILNAVSLLIDTFIKDARKKILVDKKNVKVLAGQHEDIYGALKEKNSQKAEELMKIHLEFVGKYMMKER